LLGSELYRPADRKAKRKNKRLSLIGRATRHGYVLRMPILSLPNRFEIQTCGEFAESMFKFLKHFVFVICILAI
jgi:hypothetical protein